MKFSDFFFGQIATSSAIELGIGFALVMASSLTAYKLLAKSTDLIKRISAAALTAFLSVILLEYMAFQYRADDVDSGTIGESNLDYTPEVANNRDRSIEQVIQNYEQAIEMHRTSGHFGALCDYYGYYQSYLLAHGIDDQLSDLAERWVMDVRDSDDQRCMAKAFLNRANHHITTEDFDAALRDIETVHTLDLGSNEYFSESNALLLLSKIYTNTGDLAAMREASDNLITLSDRFPASAREFPRLDYPSPRSHSDYRYYLHKQRSDYELSFGNPDQAFHYLTLASGYLNHQLMLHHLVAQHNLALVMGAAESDTTVKTIENLIAESPYDILYENRVDDGLYHPIELYMSYQKMAVQEVEHNQLNRATTIYLFLNTEYQRLYDTRSEYYSDLVEHGSQSQEFLKSEKEWLKLIANDLVNLKLDLANVYEKNGNTAEATEFTTQANILINHHQLLEK